MSYFLIAHTKKEKETGEPTGIPCVATLLTLMLYNQKQLCTRLEEIVALSILVLWASVFFWEKLPISGAGIAETEKYGPGDKHIQTQKPIVVNSEIFNTALNFQYGWKKILV